MTGQETTASCQHTDSRHVLLLPYLLQGSVFRCIIVLFKSVGVHDTLHISGADWWDSLLPLA